MKKRLDQLEDNTLAEMRFDLKAVENSLSRLMTNSEENFRKTRERFDDELKKVTADLKSNKMKG